MILDTELRKNYCKIFFTSIGGNSPTRTIKLRKLNNKKQVSVVTSISTNGRRPVSSHFHFLRPRLSLLTVIAIICYLRCTSKLLHSDNCYVCTVSAKCIAWGCNESFCFDAYDLILIISLFGQLYWLIMRKAFGVNRNILEQISLQKTIRGMIHFKFNVECN